MLASRHAISLTNSLRKGGNTYAVTFRIYLSVSYSWRVAWRIIVLCTIGVSAQQVGAETITDGSEALQSNTFVNLSEFKRFEARITPTRYSGQKVCLGDSVGSKTVLEALDSTEPDNLATSLQLYGSELRPRKPSRNTADPDCSADIQLNGICLEEMWLVHRALTPEEVALIRDAFSRVRVYSEYTPICAVAKFINCDTRIYYWDEKEFSALSCGTGIGNRAIDALLEKLRAKSITRSAQEHAVAIATQHAAPYLDDSPGLKIAAAPVIQASDIEFIITWPYEYPILRRGPEFAVRVHVNRRTMKVTSFLAGS